MNNEFSKQLIQKALQKLKSNLDRLHEKKSNQRFIQVSSDVTLQSLLNLLTKTELDQLRRILGITGASSLKKADLIIKIETFMKANLGTILQRLKPSEVAGLNQLLKSGGFAGFNDVKSTAFDFLYKVGLLYTVQHPEKGQVIVLPSDLMVSLQSCLQQEIQQSRVKFNGIIVQAAKALLHYYGIFTPDLYRRTILPELGIEISFEDVETVLRDEINRDSEIIHAEGYYFHKDVFDYRALLSEQESNTRRSLFPLTTVSFASFTSEDTLSWNEYDRTLYHYLLTNYKFNEGVAKLYVDTFLSIFKNGVVFMDMVSSLQKFLVIPGLQEFREIVKLLEDMNQHCIQWPLKGYSLIEVQEIPLNEAANKNSDKAVINGKIGRNSPCPCGSGKKYKHCCLVK